MEQIVDASVPQAEEELADVFRVFSQDRIQQRIVEQIIPVIPLAEKIVELLVIQTRQSVNACVQHVVNTVEEEKHKIIEETVQRMEPIIKEKINQATKHIKIPQVQCLNKADDKFVVVQRQVSTAQTVQKAVEVPLSQFTDKIVDNPVVAQRQISMETAQKNIETPQLQHCDEMVEQVPHVRVMTKTPEIPQLQITDKVIDVPVVSAMQVPCVCVVKKTVEDPQFEIVEKTVQNPETQFSDVVIDACLTCDVKCKVACETCVKDNMFMVAGEITVAGKMDDLSSVCSTQQQHNQQHSTRQAMQEKPEEREREERERGRKGERRKMETGRKPEEGRDAEVGKREQVKKDETGWTVVTRNKRQKKTVQIFVKLDEMKTVLREVSPEDKVQEILNTVGGSEQDVYVTCEGKMLRKDEQLKSCGVRDGSTIQVTSRMRGGGKHKDKKSKAEKKQAASAKTPEQKSTDEEESDRKEAIIRMWEENEAIRKLMDVIPEGSDVEMEQALQSHRTAGREVLGWDQGQADMMECGFRWTVEARRKGRRQQEEEQIRQGRQGQHPGQEESKQDKQVDLGDEEQARAESTDEPEVMGRTIEVRTGRGSTGLVRGGDERCRTDETSKGKGKGNGGKGEHEGKGGGFGHSGKQQEMRERERRNGSEWRQTWGPVAHTPRPRRIQERERWRKRKKPEG